MTDLPFSLPEPDPTAIERPPRKCVRHQWIKVPRLNDDAKKLLDSWDNEVGAFVTDADSITTDRPAFYYVTECARCGAVKDPARSRRNRNNGRRGRSDELTVARLLGGEKVGQLNLPWDVVVPGYLRAQAKQLDSWPSIAKVIEWLDAIPAGAEMRAVTLADTPGPGRRTRRLIVLDLGEFAERHGRETP